MRTTNHNGRTGKSGVFSGSHNDRSFAHAANPREADNRYSSYQNLPFDEAEKAFYEKMFKEYLDAKNECAIAHRNYNRVVTVDDYRKNPRTCPEEVICCIGNKAQHIDANKLWQIHIEYERWRRTKYPLCKLVNVALHQDEDGAPHIHARYVWVGQNKNGHACVSQSSALALMGVPRPDPSRPENRYNNAKITYTADCREHFLQIAKDHGIDVETEPKERSEVGLTLTEYKAREAEKRAESARSEAVAAMQATQREKQALDSLDMQKQQYLADIALLQKTVGLDDLLQQKRKEADAEKLRRTVCRRYGLPEDLPAEKILEQLKTKNANEKDNFCL